MAQTDAPPIVAPGRVISNGDVSFPPNTFIYQSVQQALKHKNGEHVLYTSDISEELPIRLAKSGIGAAEPVTIIEAFAEAVHKHGERPALAYKPPAFKNEKFRVFNWQQYWAACCKFAKALIKAGHQPRDRVVIMGVGSAFWSIAHFGTIFANGVSGSSYPTNGVEATEHIMAQSSCVVAVVDTVENMMKVLTAKQSGRCQSLKHIVMYLEDPPEEELGATIHHCVWRWSDFCSLGDSVVDAQLTERMERQSPGMCCELVYTSGTTGEAKGVMLSHDNLIWTAFSLLQMVHYTPDERVLSFLPLSHIAPQISDVYIPILSGCCTYFAQPDALKGSLIVSLHEVRPTYLFAVPRVYEKLEERMRAAGGASAGMKKRISDWVKRVGFAGTVAELSGERTSVVYSVVRATILNRIRGALGLDHCKSLGSGAAPLQPSTQDYFLSLGIPICNMYGMSECSGPQTSNAAYPGWFRRQTAGVSLPGTEILIDRPSAADGTGEVCYRGRNVFMGYFGNAEATASTIDANGFLHSGDIGYVDADGFLRITGRIKELVITAGGENVAPVPIENAIKEEMPFISNCIVIGDQAKFLSSLICLRSVPDKEGNPTNTLDPFLAELLQERRSTARSIYEASNDSVMKNIIQEGLERVNKRAISRAQRVVGFRVVPQDFTFAGGELTPTLKVKRQVVVKKYAELIEAIYAEARNDTYGNDEDTRQPQTNKVNAKL